jgi:tetratricopeptide (TPR) repeat protein
MKNSFIILGLLFISATTFSQTYYQKGILYFNNGEYTKADSLFTLAIGILPFTDAYYNRAITRLKLNNMQGFCCDLRKAAEDDKEAKALYQKECLTIDTIYHSESFAVSNNKSYSYLEIVQKEKYCDYTNGYICNKKKELIAKYRIIAHYKWFGLVPVMPENKNIKSFIKKNLQYPQTEENAYEKYAGNSCTVYIQFDISELGKITNVRISDDRYEHTIKYISKSFIDEALRVVRSLPDFKPGSLFGTPMIVRYELPITFTFPK